MKEKQLNYLKGEIYNDVIFRANSATSFTFPAINKLNQISQFKFDIISIKS